jgi:hypothetical protein
MPFQGMDHKGRRIGLEGYQKNEINTSVFEVSQGRLAFSPAL